MPQDNFPLMLRVPEGDRLRQIAFHVEHLNGGGGIVLPPSKVLTSIDAQFLTATHEGRRLVFPSGADSVEIRIANLAAALSPISSAASATWELEGLFFEHVRIGKNGYMLLGQQAPLSTTNLTWANAPNGLLAPFLDDLVMKPEVGMDPRMTMVGRMSNCPSMLTSVGVRIRPMYLRLRMDRSGNQKIAAEAQPESIRSDSRKVRSIR
jgi:hypothetical protein